MTEAETQEQSNESACKLFGHIPLPVAADDAKYGDAIGIICERYGIKL